MNLFEINKKVVEAVADHDAAFVKEHEGNLDFGCCGFAVVLLSFGRKRKIKKEFIDAGLISESRTWGSYGIKEYVFAIPRSYVPTQYMGFYEGRAEAAVKVLREELEGSGVEVNIHRWVD